MKTDKPKLIDLDRLRQDMAPLATRIKELKGIIREPGQPRLAKPVFDSITKIWSKNTFQEVLDLKFHYTAYCKIRAHHRGKIHIQFKQYENGKTIGFRTLEDQFKDIEPLWNSYKLSVPVAAQEACTGK